MGFASTCQTSSWGGMCPLGSQYLLTWKGPAGLIGTCACCQVFPLFPLSDKARVGCLFFTWTQRFKNPVRKQHQTLESHCFSTEISSFLLGGQSTSATESKSCSYMLVLPNKVEHMTENTKYSKTGTPFIKANWKDKKEGFSPHEELCPQNIPLSLVNCLFIWFCYSANKNAA